MVNADRRNISVIDAVVNILTKEALAHRPDDRKEFFVDKIGVDQDTYSGVSHETMLRRMDEAGIEKAFLIAATQGVRAHHWGFGNMPPVTGVSERQVSDIVAYVREVQKANGIF